MVCSYIAPFSKRCTIDASHSPMHTHTHARTHTHTHAHTRTHTHIPTNSSGANGLSLPVLPLGSCRDQCCVIHQSWVCIGCFWSRRGRLYSRSLALSLTLSLSLLLLPSLSLSPSLSLLRLVSLSPLSLALSLPPSLPLSLTLSLSWSSLSALSQIDGIMSGLPACGHTSQRSVRNPPSAPRARETVPERGEQLPPPTVPSA